MITLNGLMPEPWTVLISRPSFSGSACFYQGTHNGPIKLVTEAGQFELFRPLKPQAQG
jgi:hypothetical protein